MMRCLLVVLLALVLVGGAVAAPPAGSYAVSASPVSYSPACGQWGIPRPSPYGDRGEFMLLNRVLDGQNLMLIQLGRIEGRLGVGIPSPYGGGGFPYGGGGGGFAPPYDPRLLPPACPSCPGGVSPFVRGPAPAPQPQVYSRR